MPDPRRSPEAPQPDEGPIEGDPAGPSEPVEEAEPAAPADEAGPEPDDVEGLADGAGLADRAHRLLAAASLGLSALAILASLVVVTVLRRGLARAEPDHAALLAQVNPWYGAAIVSFVAALGLLVTWGLVGVVRRSPLAQGVLGAAPAGVGLAFVAVAWALSLYRKLD